MPLPLLLVVELGGLLDVADVPAWSYAQGSAVTTNAARKDRLIVGAVYLGPRALRRWPVLFPPVRNICPES